MPNTEPLLLAAIVSGLRPYFRSLGLDLDALATSCGIPSEALAEPDNLVSLVGFCDLLERAAQKADDSCFGLHCAETYPEGAVSPLGYIIMHAPDSKEAFRSMMRYMRLIYAPVNTTFREEHGRLYWSRSFPPSFTPKRLQFDLFATALMLKRLRQAVGEDFQIETLEFDHPDPGCPEECARLLSPRILYNQSVLTIIVDASRLQPNKRDGDPKLHAILKTHADELLARQPDINDITDLTRHCIERFLDKNDGGLELDEVAAELKMSARSLRSRLSEEGVTFTGLLDKVRENKARQLLVETDLPMTQVAYLLGFSELSAFSRAASRWFDSSPRAYRKAHFDSGGRVKLSRPPGQGEEGRED